MFRNENASNKYKLISVLISSTYLTATSGGVEDKIPCGIERVDYTPSLCFSFEVGIRNAQSCPNVTPVNVHAHNSQKHSIAIIHC